MSSGGSSSGNSKYKSVFHGGTPGVGGGTCFCGDYDGYCMCTPSLAVDCIILSPKYEVLLVKRRDTGECMRMICSVCVLLWFQGLPNCLE